jgi:LruC domain-containing protein
LPLGFGRTIVNPTFDVTVGFEDLPLGGGANDFDYNDWVVDIFGETNYSSNNSLQEIGFNFNPRARGAAYDHTFHLDIPHGTFGSNGTAVLTIYDKNHQVISSQTSTFVASVDNDYVIFPKTSEVFPNLSNTSELQPYIPPNRYARLDITFNNAAPFDMSKYNLSSPHGTGLFFDPYLHVINTGDTIHRGDIRILTVPVGTFMWPEEQIRIDYAYPKVTFTPGNPPTITFPINPTDPTDPNNWWMSHNTCVYGDGIPCVLPKAPDGVIASPSAPVVTPGAPTVTPP